MAEIESRSTSGSHGKPLRKKLSTRVDLTPMVDLGFLLITFFIFTTSMSEPKSMKLRMPDDRNITDPLQTAEGKTLHLILGKNHQLWHYRGTAVDNMQRSDYHSGVRSVIQKEKARVAAVYGSGNELVILIKPTSAASYRDVVDVLDEMVIHQVSRYMLMEPNTTEIGLVLR